MLKKIIITLFTLILLFFGSIFGIDYYISYKTKDFIYTSINDIPQSNTALILGTSRYLKGGFRNPFYEYRIQGGAELFKSGKINKIIVSGDNSMLSYNEPRMMTQDLIKNGVPASAIESDYAGFRTLDSIVRAKNVFNENNFVIITQKFHCERALFLAQARNINAVCYAVKDPQDMFKVRTREYLARVAAFIDIYILHKEPKFSE